MTSADESSSHRHSQAEDPSPEGAGGLSLGAPSKPCCACQARSRREHWGVGRRPLGALPGPRVLSSPRTSTGKALGCLLRRAPHSGSTGRCGLFSPLLGHSQKAWARFLGVSGTLVQFCYFYASITLRVQFWIPVLLENVVITSVSGAS